MTSEEQAETARPRCYRCHRAEVSCICADIPLVDNRTGVVILQHPRERFHPVGTAPFARLGLRRCRVEVAMGDADRRVFREVALPPDTALLYPHADAIDLATLAPAERPAHLLVLDGTWPQSRRLYDHNPWLAALPHVRFTPTEASLYKVRRPPRPEYLSTLESIVTALRILEPETQGFDGLLAAFSRMNERQAAFMRATDRAPREQRPRQRPSRKLPQELFADRLVVVYGELAAADAPGRERELLQWVAAEVDADARFESVVRPPSGTPDPRQLDHAGLTTTDLSAGENEDALRLRFRDFVGGGAVLAAWNPLTLELAREHLGQDGPTVLLKAAYTNLRGGRRGALEQVVRAEGLEPEPMPFAGRAAPRAGQAVAIARWLRNPGREPLAPATGADL